MAFEFLCPQGHLLQGDESQSGQQCKCPHCGSIFLVPESPQFPPLAPPSAPPPSAPPPAAPPGQFGYQQPVRGEMAVQPPAPPPGQLGYQQPGRAAMPVKPPAAPPGKQREEAFPRVGIGPDFGNDAFAEIDGPLCFAGRQEQNFVHILCPNGHELETPRDMLGQYAACPYCQAEFPLRYEDSREARREKAERQARREERIATLWLNWAIVAAFVVVVGVIVVVAVTVAT